MWLLIIFIVIPMIEIGLFIQVGGAIGLWPTLAIVVLTAIVGSTLIRSQGITALGRIQNSLAGADDPLDSLAHGALILVAGVVLVTPGFFTDAVGLSLMVPSIRAAVIKYFGRHMKANIHVVGAGKHPHQRQRPVDPDVVEGDFTRVKVVDPKDRH